MTTRTEAGRPAYPAGIIGVLVTVGMLFTAFTVSMLVRRTSPDWVPIDLPALLWVNTVVLALSSVALEVARSRLRRGGTYSVERWLGIASLLGVVFLAGQIVVWRQLASQGVFLPSGPHAAFFYLISAVHALHIVGGILALGWGMRRTREGAFATRLRTGLFGVAAYWHFVGIVWLLLFLALLTL